MPSPEPGIRRATASAPGTCGELAQGLLDGVLCMVTCPIDLRSVATVELSAGGGTVSAPPDSPKAAQAVRATLEFLGETGVDARLELESPLPRGKGMASSTADVAAAIAATASSSGRKLFPEQIADIALGVEPSDGVMFPGVAVFDHRDGKILRPLGDPPPMRVVVLDFGGTVDTLEFNQGEFNQGNFNQDARGAALARQAPAMAEATSLIEAGISRGDIGLIGKGATISALANQEILHNRNLDAAMALARDAGAVGVNVAHSGTVIGLLLPDSGRHAESAAALARQRLPCLESVMQCRIVGGGIILR